MGMLADRGLIDHDKPVKEYWPEFAQNGKENITIADVGRHEAGLAKLHRSYKAEDCHTEGLLENKIGTIIETDTALWPGD